jgi:hypothetical protein
VTLFIAEGERLYRRRADPLGWSYESFLGSRVGGIQYFAEGAAFSVGPAVPVQWRIPPGEFDR